MNIKIYLDIACPYCYIAKKKFEEALKEFDEVDFDIEYKSFELNYEAPKYPEETLITSLSERTGVSEEEIKRQYRILIESAKAEGIELNLENVVPSNTRDAHRLLKFAIQEGKGSETLDELYYRNFKLNENIADKDVLLSVAEAVELDTARAKEVIEGESEFAECVLEDFNYGKILGVQSVPHFIFNERFKMNGAAEVDLYIYAIEKTLDDMKKGDL